METCYNKMMKHLRNKRLVYIKDRDIYSNNGFPGEMFLNGPRYEGLNWEQKKEVSRKQEFWGKLDDEQKARINRKRGKRGLREVDYDYFIDVERAVAA